MPISPQAKPIEIKISTIVAVSAILHSTDINALDAALKKMTGGTPDFFEDDLAVIDVNAVAGNAASINWGSLISLLSTYRLNVVAVRNASPDMHEAILAHG